MFICVLVCVCTCMYFQFEETAFTLLRIMKYNIIYKSAWELLLKTQFQHYSVYAWGWGCHLQSCAFHAFHVFPALIAIGRYSMTIETVDVGWCKEITDRGATQIAQRSKSLRYLGLMRCDQVRSFFLSWCLILSVIVFLCVWGRQQVLCFPEQKCSVFTTLATVLVCCVHTGSSKVTQRARRSIINACWCRFSKYICRLHSQPEVLSSVL